MVHPIMNLPWPTITMHELEPLLERHGETEEDTEYDRIT